ncbi:hypothetical protein HDU83_009865 [Entophlyctis luteolus]|nr:hypothetical protein HDU83_009865 [Entophlyctis luteolus]
MLPVDDDKETKFAAEVESDVVEEATEKASESLSTETVISVALAGESKARLPVMLFVSNVDKLIMQRDYARSANRRSPWFLGIGLTSGSPTRGTKISLAAGNLKMDDDAWHRVVGVVLAVCSGVFIGSSFILKKKGLLMSEKTHGEIGQGHSYLKSGFWWAGLILSE